LAAQALLRHSPLTQFASEVQLDGSQVVVVAQYTPPGQGAADGVAQAPAPLQRPVMVSWPRLQERAPQVTVDVAYRQPPFPSQVPSCPQVAESTVQAPPEEPPAVTGLQVPVAQVMQVPPHAVAQQIPEMQLLCVHWVLLEQLDPSDSVAAQVFADVQ
jgi:hypothetical protein